MRRALACLVVAGTVACGYEASDALAVRYRHFPDTCAPCSGAPPVCPLEGAAICSLAEVQAALGCGASPSPNRFFQCGDWIVFADQGVESHYAAAFDARGTLVATQRQFRGACTCEGPRGFAFPDVWTAASTCTPAPPTCGVDASAPPPDAGP